MLKQEPNNVNTMAEFDEYLVTDNILSMDSVNLEELARLGSFNSQGSLVVLSPPEVSEETLDINYAMHNVPTVEETIPPSPRGPPARMSFAGGLNFAVEINAADTNRKKYLYSHQLNRIYVNIKTNFPVQFRWDFERAAAPMFVRATAVFSDDAQSEKRVERCLQHTHESANAAIDPVIVRNVLHSSAAAGTRGVFYCGLPALPDSWYSVLVRVDAPQGPCSHAYQFVCKNSCSSGINRRAIDIIFTLEDHTGQVYGRQTVGARVCACPRRDKIKDEEVEPRPHKRRLTPPHPPLPQSKGKRVKLEPDDDVLVLPPLPIVGRRTMVTGLEVMLNMMEAVATKTPEHEVDKYQTSIRALRDKIEELRGSQPE